MNVKKNKRASESSPKIVIAMIFGFFIGAFALSLELFFQQAVIGSDPLLIKNYLIPVVFGGFSGIFLAFFIFKKQNLLEESLYFERKLRIQLEKKLVKAQKVLIRLKMRLQKEVADNAQTTSELRKTKYEMSLLTESTPNLGKVLIVDDDYNYVKFLQDSMNDSDFTVLPASSGREGLIKLAETPIDLVISDYKMPEMDGPEFLKNVQLDYPGVSRAVLSDFEYQPSVIKILTEGLATSVLLKPKNNDVSLFNEGITRILKLRKTLNDKKIQELISSIEQFPRLPGIFNEFSEAVQKEVNFQQLAEIIRKDNKLVTKFLQISNYAFYGNEKKPTLEEVIMMLGVNAARDILLTTSLTERGTQRTSHMEYFHKIMNHSAVVNKYLEPLSRIVYGKSIEKNFKSVGLTHDIGKIILLQNFPDRFDKIISYQLRKPKLSFYDCEIALGHSDCTHTEIGAYFLDLWTFPAISIEVALYHHTPSKAKDVQHNEILGIVSLSNEIANFLARTITLENINFNDFLRSIKKELA